MKKPKVDPAVSAAAKAMGAVGGRNGTGASKKRSAAHYRKLAAARQAARLRRIAEATNG
jgi:hypothetical protein